MLCQAERWTCSNRIAGGDTLDLICGILTRDQPTGGVGRVPRTCPTSTDQERADSGESKQQQRQQKTYSVITDIPPFERLPEELMLPQFQAAPKAKQRQDNRPCLTAISTKRQ